MSRYNDPSHVGFQSEREAAARRNVSERARAINLALTRYLQAKPNADSATLTAGDYDFMLRCYRRRHDRRNV